MVITNAAMGNPLVKGPMYVDAFEPAAGETVGQLTGFDDCIATLVPSRTAASSSALSTAPVLSRLGELPAIISAASRHVHAHNWSDQKGTNEMNNRSNIEGGTERV
jgi:hypothetical protein